MGQILTRDSEFYQPSIPMEAIEEMNRFAKAVGVLSGSGRAGCRHTVSKPTGKKEYW